VDTGAGEGRVPRKTEGWGGDRDRKVKTIICGLEDALIAAGRKYARDARGRELKFKSMGSGARFKEIHTAGNRPSLGVRLFGEMASVLTLSWEAHAKRVGGSKSS